MFRFKQFSIEDDGATMKVGTDAVMLGALVSPIKEPQKILDIGTGCGVIALMMAQRFGKAQIDSIDIDSQTIEVAKSNFVNSPWSERLQAENISLQHFAQRINDEQRGVYDIIVCNPPYFSNSLKNNEARRAIARHDDTLSLVQLFDNATTLLSAEGQLVIIIPSDIAQRAIDDASKNRLHLTKRIDIVNHIGDKPKRTVLQFAEATVMSHYESQYVTIAMRNADNNYSATYIELTQPFLL